MSSEFTNVTPANSKADLAENGELSVTVDAKHGGLAFLYRYSNPLSEAKALAASQALGNLYGTESGDQHFFQAPGNRLDRDVLVKAVGILAKNGFVPEAGKETFIHATRKAQLQGLADVQLDSMYEVAPHAARTDVAKPLVAMLETLAKTGDMATLSPEQLAQIQAVANKDDRVLRQTVPVVELQADFQHLCDAFKSEIEAAVLQPHRTIEADPSSAKLPDNTGRGGR